MTFTDFLNQFWQDIAGWVLIAEFAMTAIALVWVLHLKREPMSAIAWSLTVVLVPFLGAFLFFLFGYQIIHRPLLKRRTSKHAYRSLASNVPAEAKPGTPPDHTVLILHIFKGFRVSGRARPRLSA